MIVSQKYGEKWILVQYPDAPRDASGRMPTISFRAWDGDRWGGNSSAQGFESREDAEKYLADNKDQLTAAE